MDTEKTIALAGAHPEELPAFGDSNIENATDESQKNELREHSFHFAKSQGSVLQRELNQAAIEAAADIDWLCPYSGISPLELQPHLRDVRGTSAGHSRDRLKFMQ